MVTHLRANLSQLCRSRAPDLARQLDVPAAGSGRLAVLVIILGCGAYGFTLGMGRAPLMGCYVAVKLPLLIFLTLSINAMLNGMLAQVLGSGLTFRQTWSAIVQSFALFALIVGSIAPVAAYFTMNADFQRDGGNTHAILLLLHVVVIATAGIAANFRLLSALKILLPEARMARNVLVAWLLGNLFVGAQFSYLLRPFFGQPNLEIQFLRPDAFVGNFYHTVWKMSGHLIGASGVLALLLIGFVLFLLCLRKQANPNQTP